MGTCTSRGRRARRHALVLPVLLAGLAGPPSAHADVPAPCGGPAQITDVAGDGHHPNTDVVQAWFAESPSGLRAVIRPSEANWGSLHEDGDTATWALVFSVGDEARYVRLSARTGAADTYDHGTWTPSGGFRSAGATTGATTTGAGGALVIDVPAAVAGPSGSVLARPFVLTSDGFDAPEQPHWVDRAPGGTSPAESAFGADFVVGSCAGAPAPGGGPGPGTQSGPGQSAAPLTSVLLSVRPRRTGPGTETVSGRVVPERAGVVVTITARRAGATTTRTATTAADGRFSARVPIAETTTLRAVAEGLGSQTRTVTVTALVRVTVRRLRSGAAVVTGTVRPAVPGRVIWLRTSAITPSARATVRDGRFTFRLRRPVRGRYQALFTPLGTRAERSTSNTGVIR